MATSPVTLQEQGAIGVLRIDNPPVNALSPAVIQGLAQALAAFEANASLQALVVHCEGRTFVAGGDIAVFDDPSFSAAPLNAWLARLESQDRPVVAALHGTALGGGLELAMACHWRIAAPGTRVGMPEIKLGLIPGSLGTQRLPRLAGAPLALDMITTGRMVDLQEALAAGIVDEVTEGALLDAAVARGRELAAEPGRIRRASRLHVRRDGMPADFIAQARAAAQAKSQYPAQLAAVNAVEAAITLPYDQGEQVEAREFGQLLHSRESKAMRHLFFAERQAAKIPGLPPGAPAREIRGIRLIGDAAAWEAAASLFAKARVPVTREGSAAEGDVVVVAAVGAVPDLQRGGEAAVGLHFPAGAETGRAVELVRGAATAPDVLAGLVRLVQKAGRIAIVSGLDHGTLATRTAAAARGVSGELAQARAIAEEGKRLLDEGVAWRASDIDMLWTAGFGFPDYRGGPMHLAATA